MSVTKYHYKGSVIRICVDMLENGQISGRVYSPCLMKPLLFTDIGNLLIQVDEMFDTRGYPDAYQKKRSFVDQPPAYDIKMDDMGLETLEKNIALTEQYHGKIDTLLVYVTTRQNATWQGKIEWTKAGKMQTFKSALELIRMMDAVLLKNVPIEEALRRKPVTAQ